MYKILDKYIFSYISCVHYIYFVYIYSTIIHISTQISKLNIYAILLSNSVFSYSSWASHGKYSGVGLPFPLQWITVYQNSPLWPVHLRWPYTAQLIASLSYPSPFAPIRQWSMKGFMDHNKLWKAPREMEIPDHLTCLLRNLYVGQEATVRISNETTEWFQSGRSMTTFILSTCLFNFYVECVYMLGCCSRVRLFSTPRTAIYQAPLSRRFSRQNTGVVAMPMSKEYSQLRE